MEQKKRSGSYINGHLNSAITRDELDFIKNFEKFFCNRHREIKNIVESENIQSHIYEDSCKCHPYDCLKNALYNEIAPTLDDKKIEKQFDKILETSASSLKIHINNILSCYQGSVKEGIESYLTKVKQLKDEKMLLSYKDKIIAETVKDKMCYTPIQFGTFITIGCLRIDSDIFFFDCPRHGKTFGPTALLLACLDEMQSRFPLYMYWKLSDIQEKYPMSMYSIGSRLIVFFENIRSQYPKEVYGILNQWEPLLLGWIIQNEDEDLGYKNLYENACKEINDEIPGFDFKEMIPNVYQEDIIRMYLELTGILKTFGHPCLDLKPGFDKLKQHACERVAISEENMHLVVRTFRKHFCLNYYQKHRKWPLMETHLLHPELRKYVVKNTRPLRVLKLDLIVWESVVFSQNFDFEVTVDTSELIKDSAIALPLDSWPQNFDHCAFKNYYNKPKPWIDLGDSTSRLILRFLQGDLGELDRKIQELDAGYFNPNDNVAILCRKEREINKYGRYFVKQPYLQRLAQVCMEKNISEKLMPYIIEQTMTNSELQLLNKHCQTVKSMQGGVEIVCMDFQKWCLKFRQELLWKFGRDLDRLFGKNLLFTNAHLWFISSTILINSRFAAPDYNIQEKPVEGDFCTKEFLGGMEGMHQKKWTIFQIYAIHYCAEQIGLRISIAAQGDNQVVLIKYSKDQIVFKDVLRNKFLTTLENFTNSLNLKLKMKETWVSKQLFEYGKQRYYKFQTVSQATKKASRLIPDINDGVCSFMSSLSSINTITESIARADHMPENSFFINQFEICHYLIRKGVTKPEAPTMLCLLFFPGIFGGLTLSSLYAHSVRGHDDKLTLWLSLIKTFIISHPELKEKIFTLVKLRARNHKNISRLIEDIFCLNITSLPNIEMDFKQKALDYLQSEDVTNPEITRLFSMTSITPEELTSQIQKMVPFYPPLAHELVRNSNFGILLSKRNKFSNIQTINKILQKEEDTNYLDDMAKNNKEIISVISQRLKSSPCRYTLNLIDSMLCPTILAHELRKEHWGLDLIGDTKPYPIHQFTLKPYDSCTPSDLRRGIQITLSSKFITSTKGFLETVGPFSPYIGSTTQEKIRKPNIDTFQSDDYTKSLQQLNIIKTWMDRVGDESINNFVDLLIKEKIPVLSPELQQVPIQDWCVSVYGGNIIHRLQSVIEKRSGMINFLPLVSTHFKFCTDDMHDLMKKGKDYTIFFQLVFVTLISLITKIRFFSDEIEKSYVAVIDCGGCTQEVTDVRFTLNSDGLNETQNVGVSETRISRIIPVNNRDVINWLSVFTGHAIGISSDQLFYSLYQKNTSPWEEAGYQYQSSIGVTEFKACNFEYLVVGLFQASRILRNHISDTLNNPVDKLDKTLMNLASMLLTTRRLKDFLDYLGISIYEHSHGTDPGSLAPLLMRGIIQKIIKNRDRFLHLFLTYNYSSEEIHRVYHRVSWLIKYMKLRPLLGPAFMKMFDTRKYKTIHYFIPKIIKCLKLEIVKFSFDITEDKIILIWRSLLVKGVDFSKIDKVIEVPEDDNMTTFIPYNYESLLSAYTKINSLKTGEEVNIKNIHHMCRPLGSVSSACNKMLEVILAFGLHLESNSVVATLAEGSGSIALLFRKIFKCEILFNTLMDPEIDPRIGLLHNLPPAFLNGNRSDIQSLKFLDVLCAGETDILTDKFFQKFESILPIKAPGIITIDAESKTSSTNLIFTSKYIGLVKKHHIKYLIVKLFFSTGITTALDAICNESFVHYIIYKPLSSNLHNKECYCVIYNDNIPLETKKMLSHYKTREPEVLEILNCGKVTDLSLDIFINEMKIVNLQLKTFNKNFGINMIYKDKLSNLIQSGTICSIMCIQHVEILFEDLLQYNEEHLEYNTFYSIVFRNEGQKASMVSKSALLTSLLYLRAKNLNVNLAIKALSKCYVVFDFIGAGRIACEDNILSLMNDSKIFFKRVFSGRCECTRTTVYADKNLAREYDAFLRDSLDVSMLDVLRVRWRH
nr:MAG: RNA-dependent RNA polymerase [Xinmoviridae sp. 2]